MRISDWSSDVCSSDLCKTARPKSRNTTLVRDFGQGVGLVHELRQLAGTEELFDCRGNRLGVDQVVRHEIFGLGLAQTFFHCTLDAHQTGTELVFGQFADTTHAAGDPEIGRAECGERVCEYGARSVVAGCLK